MRALNIPFSSGDLNASAPGLGLASVNGPLAGVPLVKRDEGPVRSEPVDERRAESELRALFHCLTSSTAWLKLAGALETGALARREPAIQAWRNSFRAVTLRLGSFWKHCMRKSLAACVASVREGASEDLGAGAYSRNAFGDRGMVIVDDGEQSRHGRQVVIGRLALQQLDDGAADAPYVRGGAGAG